MMRALSGIVPFKKGTIMEDSAEYEKARKIMVERQLAGRGIRDRRVLEAMARVPRHLFIPEELRELAYADQPLPIDREQTISQPYIVALMTEALDLSEDAIVLEIGTGSGYQSAILAEISRMVYTVEKYPELLEKASKILGSCGYNNIVSKVDDGTMGWPEYKPYDAIIVTAGAPHVPQPLLDQLAERGRLLVPVGDSTSQELLKLTRSQNGYSQQRLGGCRFVPLRGEHGWQM
jgi:protein-L-isoaspartate(D-aspartate) O-methyltransferase